ncbi:placenta-specific gene 8 protein-like [Paroedura picta]|uniref:placenta-specific gene 8 protein-like n=1 Tax=Paroedura picta TaxID=143630 RepID=UPI004056D14F
MEPLNMNYYSMQPNVVTLEMRPPPVIMAQPQRYLPTRTFEWQTDLYDCGNNCRICLCGTFCFYCLGCNVAKDMDECCCCGSSVAMRTRYRTQYQIPGTICSDCLIASCCAPCSLCQLRRDIDKRKDLGIF